MLATTRTIIVDEIHAVAANKRGSHLALTLERLSELCARRLCASAFRQPRSLSSEWPAFLSARARDRATARLPHHRYRPPARPRPGDRGARPRRSKPSCRPKSGRDLWTPGGTDCARTAPPSSLSTRVASPNGSRASSPIASADNVTAHHGSLAKEHRLDAEQRLNRGKLKALVATASLELGIDIGDIDLVCQIGSPRSIASFLQRVGSSGHAVDGTPKGRLFPLSRDDLVECAAFLDSVPARRARPAGRSPSSHSMCRRSRSLPRLART